MPATLSDVAARAGVSVSAASRALANAPSARISPETRLRIEQAAHELGYRPNFAGRALKLARSNVIALVVPDLANAIFTDLIRGAEDGAAEQGYVLLLGRSEVMQPGGDMVARLIGEGRVDGALIQVAENVHRQDAALDVPASTPLVFVNSLHDSVHSSASLPNAAGARLATEHLLGLGHRHVGFIGGTRTVGTSADREAGFRQALSDAGIRATDAQVTRLGYTADQGREALRRVWARPGHPTALVVANLNAAIGALAESRALGIRVPEDLSITALHDAWTAEHTWPALTTVRMPLYQLGRVGAQLLIERLAGVPSRHVEISTPPPELIVRGSTVAPRPAGRSA